MDAQSPNLRLHAFILSNTPFASLGWPGSSGANMSKPEIEALGVLFQADDALTYVDTMMQRIVAATSQTVPAQGGVE